MDSISIIAKTSCDSISIRIKPPWNQFVSKYSHADVGTTRGPCTIEQNCKLFVKELFSNYIESLLRCIRCRRFSKRRFEWGDT
ncbi:Hypothetical protein CINCED_3A017205 [Cinara cedri]|uniref:Uncharacterized protein n=1 Tax=Cinara cedri TaxID=506608 RepID=A0A5E4M4X5_9HEMI|nr:Hypothetical protein CINCED_3A017205 [Cinara cedri]